VLDQVTRELNIEALPTSIPDAIHHDVSEMEMNDTLMLSAITAPEGVTLLDDLEETVVATLSPPRVEEEPEIEEETELIGEDGEPIEAPEGEAEGEGEAGAEGDGGGEASGDDSGGE
jgi:large subunit ribosomal protein L25